MKQWQNLTNMLQNDEVIEEMIKKYRNSVLGIKKPNDSVFYAQYNHYKGGFFNFTMSNGDQIQIHSDTDMELFIPNPEKGLYNTRVGAVFFCRNPLRQWKRGLTRENVNMMEVNHSVMGRPYTNIFDHIWDEVLNWGDNTLSVPEALLLASENGSAAINKTYGVVAHPRYDDGFILMHNQFIIGEIDEKTILIRNPIFKQEILDTQTNWCPTHKILEA
jgi:hypothetical protein